MNETFDIEAYMTKGVERTEPVKQLDCDDWKRIFDEAGALGVSFILLAG